jgi:hypothetical protein
MLAIILRILLTPSHRHGPLDFQSLAQRLGDTTATLLNPLLLARRSVMVLHGKPQPAYGVQTQLVADSQMQREILHDRVVGPAWLGRAHNH